jgi:1-deoxy-D-xylulose-5-phosphate synthase
MIRYPKAQCPPELGQMSLPLEHGRGVWLKREAGSRVCLAFSGSLCLQAFEAAGLLADAGLNIDLYNIRFLKPVDEDYLENVMNSYDAVVFAEEGSAAGGFGEYAAALARERGCGASTLVLAATDGYARRGNSSGTRADILRNAGLDGRGIAEAVRGATERYHLLERGELLAFASPTIPRK